jgi:hypothetical protein
MATKRNRFMSFLASPIWQFLSVLISIFALLVAVMIPMYENRIDELKSDVLALQGMVDDKDAQLATLSEDLRNRDNEILSLREQLKADRANELLDLLAKNGTAQFEWQWAGENWYGRLTFETMGTDNVISQATVGLLEKTKDDDKWMTGQVLDLAPDTNGTFNFTADGLDLALTVEKKDRRDGTVGITTINGSLRPTLCYAGTVTYADHQGSYNGDMVLVNFVSQLSSQVDDWFANRSKRAWFESYLLDK